MPLKKTKRNFHTTDEPWILENMSEIFSKVKVDDPSDESVQETHTFFSTFKDAIEWRVTLKFCNNELQSGFMIFFDAVNKLEPKNHVTCNFYLVDADGNTYFLGRKNRKFDSWYYYFPEVCSSISINYGESRNAIDKLLPNDAMTLHIELLTYLDDNPIFPMESMEHSSVPVSDLSDEFIELYKCQKKTWDVIIQVQGVGFQVHKTVLKKRCPTIYDMVALQEKADNSNNQLAFTDIDPDVFERVLKFIYTGKVQDLDNYAEYLLIAASKFGLERLKNLCEFSLATHYLTYENASEVQKLARSCNAFQLFNNAIMLQRNIYNGEQIDYSCTPSGTLIMKRMNGTKAVYENHFKDGIPEGIRIVEE